MKLTKTLRSKQIRKLNGNSLKIIGIIFSVVILIQCSAIKINHEFYNYGKYTKRKINCIDFIKYIGTYWNKDKEGDLGFRRFVSYDLINNCDCKKYTITYDTFIKYLGKPNYYIDNLWKIHTYSYTLVKKPGNNYPESVLEIKVDTSKKKIIFLNEVYNASVDALHDNYWINFKRVLYSPDLSLWKQDVKFIFRKN